MTDRTTQFEAILRQHQSMVFSIAYHVVHDRTQAEEIAQDVFLQLYRVLDSLDSPEHVVFWLRRVTVHRSIDYIRSNGVRTEVPLEEIPEPASADVDSDPMLSRRLRELVASLPEKARAVVVLRFQEELEPREIATTLKMPLATVKSHLQRSLAMLRDKALRTIGEVRR
jgi:RNA polymerase sigma-70 factor (ECF subfamily)